MEHVVFFPAHDGSPAFRRVSSLEDAVRLVEHLRNVENVAELSVHALSEVPLAFKTFYRVEVPADAAPVAPVAPVDAFLAASLAAPVEVPALSPWDAPLMEIPAVEPPLGFAPLAVVPPPLPEVPVSEVPVSEVPVVEVPVPEMSVLTEVPVVEVAAPAEHAEVPAQLVPVNELPDEPTDAPAEEPAIVGKHHAPSSLGFFAS